LFRIPRPLVNREPLVLALLLVLVLEQVRVHPLKSGTGTGTNPDTHLSLRGLPDMLIEFSRETSIPLKSEEPR
jgi:hypothetical protein